MNKNFKTSQQGGFTLIELIVVIVILGILAATALPKFASLGGDAREASLRAARGAVTSTAAMVHAEALVNNRQTGNVSLEGQTVALAFGYPAVGSLGQARALAAAAGLGASDYAITFANGGMTFAPVGVRDPATCSVVYVPAAAADTAPTYVTRPANGNFVCD